VNEYLIIDYILTQKDDKNWQERDKSNPWGQHPGGHLRQRASRRFPWIIWSR